jgi:gliding motility-associated-like protein
MVGNYSITYQTNSSGVIIAKQLTITDPTITKSKEYDKTLTANTTAGTLSGLVTVGSVTDAVTSSSLGTYSTFIVGANKTITVVYRLAGADKDNYIKPVDKVYTDGVITVRSLTISATASDKVYDGNTTATATLTDNRITGDDFTIEKTGAIFNNKNIGTSKAVTVNGITLTGTDAGNYTITSSTAAGTASITVKSLTISAIVTDKQYDGNTTATATLTDDRISGDVLTVNKTGATFNNKNIGTSKAVTVNGITLTGTDSGNYTLTSATAAGTSSITVKSLTISATASDKVYDGNTNALVTFIDNRISGDVLSVNKTSATFNNKNIGVGKPVTVSGINLTGIDADNYILSSSTASGTASITLKSIIITAIANDKPYDGNKNATVALSSNGLIISDIITLNKILAEFDNPEVGNNKLVTISGISIAGIDAINYSLINNSATTNASIIAPATIIFEIPNAFTPNGDGLNDNLRVISNAGVRSLSSFKIFSRSGNLVFESRDLSRGWDGRFKDNLLPADIYYWTAVYVDRNNQTNSKTGTVLLLK